MEFHTYVIYSISLDRYYIGHCRDLTDRVSRHNQGNGTAYTKKAKDWVLKWSKGFPTRAEAARFESAIKKKKSRRYIEWLITTNELG